MSAGRQQYDVYDVCRETDTLVRLRWVTRDAGGRTSPEMAAMRRALFPSSAAAAPAAGPAVRILHQYVLSTRPLRAVVVTQRVTERRPHAWLWEEGEAPGAAAPPPLRVVDLPLSPGELATIPRCPADQRRRSRRAVDLGLRRRREQTPHHRWLANAQMCSLCAVARRTVRFVPCGHLLLCIACTRNWISSTGTSVSCFYCRQPAQTVVIDMHRTEDYVANFDRPVDPLLIVPTAAESQNLWVTLRQRLERNGGALNAAGIVGTVRARVQEIVNTGLAWSSEEEATTKFTEEEAFWWVVAHNVGTMLCPSGADAAWNEDCLVRCRRVAVRAGLLHGFAAAEAVEALSWAMILVREEAQATGTPMLKLARRIGADPGRVRAAMRDATAALAEVNRSRALWLGRVRQHFQRLFMHEFTRVNAHYSHTERLNRLVGAACGLMYRRWCTSGPTANAGAAFNQTKQEFKQYRHDLRHGVLSDDPQRDAWDPGRWPAIGRAVAIWFAKRNVFEDMFRYLAAEMQQRQNGELGMVATLKDIIHNDLHVVLEHQNLADLDEDYYTDNEDW